MGKLLICLVGLFWLTIASRALAIYDPLAVPNNRFGIHILETSELEKAAELINSSGGQWGYVTIPIRANDRDLPKWTGFMTKSRALKIIPILRIASYHLGDGWAAPNEYDLIDFANFLDELPWPIKNRYLVVYNEPNHEGEWGGFVNPAEYARVLDRAIDIFHQKNEDFFVIAAGMDASSGAYRYEQAMNETWPGIFDRVDGLAFHAYGNPGFDRFPNIYSKVNVASYRYEYSYSDKKPIFITEAGWTKGFYYYQAFSKVWIDKNIVAVTPFVLTANAGPFKDFSFTETDGNWRDFARQIIDLPKIAGQPALAPVPNILTKAPLSIPREQRLPQFSNIFITFNELIAFFKKLINL